jgi:hypothetical protein
MDSRQQALRERADIPGCSTPHIQPVSSAATINAEESDQVNPAFCRELVNRMERITISSQWGN